MKRLLLATSLVIAAQAATADVKRYPLPNSNFPISLAVSVPSDTQLIYHSGMVPGPSDKTATPGSKKFYGDTKTQTVNVFERFKMSLTAMGLNFGDVAKMTVFLVGDPDLKGQMDFKGFMEAYTQYFGTQEQPNLPARSVVQVAGLAGGPGMMVEIEVILAKPEKS